MLVLVLVGRSELVLAAGGVDPPLQSVTLWGGVKDTHMPAKLALISPKLPQNTPSRHCLGAVWEPSDPSRADATLRGEG